MLTSLFWSVQPTVVNRQSPIDDFTSTRVRLQEGSDWLNPQCCVQKCPRISLGHESWGWEKSPICQKKKRENWWWRSKTTPHDCCLVALITADVPCISKWLEWFISHPSGPSISGFLKMGNPQITMATLTLETSMFYQARAPRYVCWFKQTEKHLTSFNYSYISTIG